MGGHVPDFDGRAAAAAKVAAFAEQEVYRGQQATIERQIAESKRLIEQSTAALAELLPRLDDLTRRVRGDDPPAA